MLGRGATMESCDVLIVGGGPAGSSCAWRLGRAGIDVLIVDRARFPRQKPCAGWITPPVLAELEIDPAAYGEGRTLEPILGFRTAVMSGTQIETRYDRPVSYAIRRAEFDTYLLHRSGARLRLGEPVTRLRRTTTGWTVNGSMRARVLVGAGGHFCPVSRQLNPPASIQTTIASQVVEYELNDGERVACAAAPGTPEIFLSRDLAGYGWIVRKGRFVNVGFGHLGSARFASQRAGFVAHLRAIGRVPPGLPAVWPGHAYLTRDHRRPVLAGDGVLVVGDAAGLADASSGEGIRPAIISGLAAAETLIAARGDYAPHRLQSYVRALGERLGTPGAGASAFRLLPSGLRTALATRFLQTRWGTRRFLLDRWLSP